MSIAGRLILAYHGCDAATEQALIERSTQLRPSNNPYDWLGEGAYFFEEDAPRALHLARTASEQPLRRLTARPIATPAVVGAVLRISFWLDLTTQEGVDEFSAAYEILLQDSTARRRPMPRNRAADVEDDDLILHNLDRAASRSCTLVVTRKD